LVRLSERAVIPFKRIQLLAAWPLTQSKERGWDQARCKAEV
jgi:hypothetical protein